LIFSLQLDAVLDEAQALRKGSTHRQSLPNFLSAPVAGYTFRVFLKSHHQAIKNTHKET